MAKINKYSVEVKTTTDEAGIVSPLAVYWDDEPYPVEITKIRELDTLHNSRSIYFTVKACGKTVGLTYDRNTNNWFLEIQGV